MRANRILQATVPCSIMSIKKLALLLLLPATLTQAAEPKPSPSLPPAPVTLKEAEANVQRAADMRRQADHLRTEAESVRKRDELACYAKILVNACRDKVRKENIEHMQVVRQLDIDANQIDRIAKARKVELEMMDKAEPKPTVRPLPEASAAAGTPKPTASPLAPGSKPKTSPPLQISPEAQARSNAEREQREKKAEADRKGRNDAAAKRAEQAKKDADRYAQHEREYKEKKARKAAEAASSAPH